MRCYWLVPVLLFAVGCKSTDGGKTASTADPKTKPKHWLDGPSPDWAKGDVPKAGTWADPRDAKFDYTNYVKGALAGYVLDIGEKPAPNAVISVELADPGSQAGVHSAGWHHDAIVRVASNIVSLYVDGALVNSDTVEAIEGAGGDSHSAAH